MKVEHNAMNTTMTSTMPGCDDVVVQTLPLFEMMRMRAATTARRHPTLGFAAPNPQSFVQFSVCRWHAIGYGIPLPQPVPVLSSGFRHAAAGRHSSHSYAARQQVLWY